MSSGSGAIAAGGTGVSSSEALEIDVEFLTLIHDIIRTIEKDNQDVSQKNKDSLEASQKVAELSAKIDEVRNKVYKLPGVAYSKEDQLATLKALRKQLALKKALITKYKELNLKVSGLSGGGGGGLGLVLSPSI